MTIDTRNKTILAGISVTVSLIAVFLFAVVLMYRHGPVGTRLTAVLASLAGELLFSISAMIVLYFSFRKTKSPEIFFFIIFLISMSFDSLKASFELIRILDLPPYYGVLITRAVYFGRFLGTLAILAGGLFSLGAEYQRMEIYLGVAFLLAFTLAAAVTVDMTQPEPYLLYNMGNVRELGIVSTLFLSFGVFNFVLYAIQNSSRDHLLIAGGLALVIAGREILFFVQNPIVLGVAFLLLVSGTTLFGERTHVVHLWS